MVVGDRVFVSEAYTAGGLCVKIANDFSAKVAWRAPKFGTYLMTAVAQDGCLFGGDRAVHKLAPLHVAPLVVRTVASAGVLGAAAARLAADLRAL